MQHAKQCVATSQTSHADTPGHAACVWGRGALLAHLESAAVAHARVQQVLRVALELRLAHLHF